MLTSCRDARISRAPCRKPVRASVPYLTHQCGAGLPAGLELPSFRLAGLRSCDKPDRPAARNPLYSPWFAAIATVGSNSSAGRDAKIFGPRSVQANISNHAIYRCITAIRAISISAIRFILTLPISAPTTASPHRSRLHSSAQDSRM